MKSYLPIVEVAIENIESTLASIKEEYLLYKPMDGIFTIGEHLYHIGYSIHWCIDNLILDQKYPHLPPLTVNNLPELVRYNREACQRFKQVFMEKDYPVDKMFYWLEIIDHCTYHRAQVAIYCRLLKISPPPYKFI